MYECKWAPHGWSHRGLEVGVEVEVELFVCLAASIALLLEYLAVDGEADGDDKGHVILDNPPRHLLPSAHLPSSPTDL